MKEFLIRCSKFLGLVAVVVIIASGLSTFVCRSLLDLGIPTGKNILLVGNSHPESAVDDQIVSEVYNLAQSGSGFFYSYLKVKAFLSQNPGIDTVIIGYSQGDITTETDEWFYGPESIRFKLRSHFLLFNLEDYIELFLGNPIEVLQCTPPVIFYNLKTLMKGPSSFGSFVRLERQKLDEAIERLNQTREKRYDISNLQQDQLLRIYSYCVENDIQVILLNTPLHPLLREQQSYLNDAYLKLASEEMPKAILIDHSAVELSDECFGDLGHLNYKGAELYSVLLHDELGN